MYNNNNRYYTHHVKMNLKKYTKIIKIILYLTYLEIYAERQGREYTFFKSIFICTLFGLRHCANVNENYNLKKSCRAI